MMKYLLAIVAGTLLVTYAWGWCLHVPDKEMTPQEYTMHYYHEAYDLGLYLIEEAKKPLLRPKTTELS